MPPQPPMIPPAQKRLSLPGGRGRRFLPHPWPSPLGWLLGGLLLGTISCSAPPGEESAPPAQGLEARNPQHLRLLYSRAPVTFNPHLATGAQDFEAGRIVLEPLASADATGTLVPILAAEIPSQANGGLATDGRSVTWVLRSGLTWSDGTPLTAADVVFTYNFLRNPQVAASTAQYYEDIASVEAVDDRTVRITFTKVTPSWQIPFTGQTGVILPRHQWEPLLAPREGTNGTEGVGQRLRQASANRQPIGTGPYQVASFEGSQVTLRPNPRYREAPPAFAQVEWVGGMAPYAAAREVLALGNGDFAHNLQVEATRLTPLQAQGEGQVETVFGGLVEQLMLNPTDPNQTTPEGERSSRQFPHPILADLRVRQAIAHGIDRQAIATSLYGFTGQPTDQLVFLPTTIPDPYPYGYDPARAEALLTEAGWVDSDGNGIRDRNGLELRLVFQTAVSPIRQATQAQVQEDLAALGIGIDIRRVRVDDFFSANPTRTQSINHFYADLQAYTTGSDHPDPAVYLGWWRCDQIAAQANNWQLPNNARYCDPDYDALWEAAQGELNPEARLALVKEMNQKLLQSVVMIPLVHRAIANGVHRSLAIGPLTPWDASTWQIGLWRRIDPTPPPPADP